MLRPSADDVRYALDGWPAADRALVTTALHDLDALYRWEPGLVLAVPAPAESDVDRLIEDLLAGGDTEGLDEDRFGDGRFGDGTGDGGEVDGGEEAQAAMADLFVAADRLRQAPWDQGVAAGLFDAVDAVNRSLPPYGVHPQVWRHVQKLGTALAGSASADHLDHDGVAAAARSLRDLLRDYV
ncbi:MAG: hypothetical protein AB1673_05030 [Actinomycetota bacterium]